MKKTLKFLLFSFFAVALAACDGGTEDGPETPGNGDNNNNDNTEEGFIPVGTFKRRSLCIDFTGTWCGYCPFMAAALNEVVADKDFTDRVVLAAHHSGDDPMKVSDDQNLDRAYGSTGYPYMNIDFTRGFTNQGLDADIRLIKRYVNLSQSEAALAGIAAKSEYADGKVTVTADVTADATSPLRVGAWLVENGLQYKQTNYGSATLEGDFDTHNHVLRLIDSRVSALDFSGYDLGEVEAGATAQHIFEWTLDSKWTAENCGVIVFVTAPNSAGKYVITNVVELKSLNASCELEYNK